MRKTVLVLLAVVMAASACASNDSVDELDVEPPPLQLVHVDEGPTPTTTFTDPVVGPGGPQERGDSSSPPLVTYLSTGPTATYPSTGPDGGAVTDSQTVALGLMLCGTGLSPVDFTNDGGESTTVPVELIALPSVAGMSVSDAERELLGLNLDVTIVERPNETVPRGEVVQQSPLAGQKVEPRSEVALFVSAGVPDQVPNVIGMDQTSALDMLESLGYSATVEFVSDVRGFGEVVTQLPAPGTELPAGGSVVITISSGPEKVPVPILESATLNTAFEALHSAEFRVTPDNKEEASETIEEDL